MTDLRTAAQLALEALDTPIHEQPFGLKQKAITALRDALAQHDKDRVWIEQRKADWALQKQLAAETPERDRQQREYEEAREAELEQEPVAKYSDIVSDGGMDPRNRFDAPPQRKPQDVQCPHCGKVTKPDDIHTCSPRRLTDEVRMLQDQNTELDRKLAELSERRLTDEVIADLWYKNGTHHHHFARAIERWLRGEE